jgi:hypothetical protein
MIHRRRLLINGSKNMPGELEPMMLDGGREEDL